MNKIIGLGTILILLGVLIYACQKKQEPTKTPISIDEQEVLVNMEKMLPKEVPSNDSIGYDPSRTEDFWIKGEPIIAMYAKDYTIQDALVYHKDMPDSIPRNAGYIKGTKYGNKIFFLEYYIDSEIGIEKYVMIDDLVRDPRETEFWNRWINEGAFETLEEAIEKCACLDYPGSEEAKNNILRRAPTMQTMTPEETMQAQTSEEAMRALVSKKIKEVLIEYTNLYQR